MKFSELMLAAIGQSEIPLRFEPGAEEAVAGPVTEMLRAWVAAHIPDSPASDFDYGKKAVITELLAELDDQREIGVER